MGAQSPRNFSEHSESVCSLLDLGLQTLNLRFDFWLSCCNLGLPLLGIFDLPLPNFCPAFDFVTG